jgi:hypothetical protein
LLLQNAELINLNDQALLQCLVDAAIAGGHVSTLRWLCTKADYALADAQVHWNGENLFSSCIALRNGHYDMVKHLHAEHFLFLSCARENAVHSGSVRLLALLIELDLGLWSASDDSIGSDIDECLCVAG